MTRADLLTREFVTVAEVAAYLRCARQTVYRLEKAGTLPTRRLPSLNGRALFDAQQLARFGTAEDTAARTRALLKTAV